MKSEKFLARVLTKETRSVGIFFKTKAYYMTLRFIATGVVTERRVSIQTFYDCKVGRDVRVTMYQATNGDWRFSKAEAEIDRAAAEGSCCHRRA